LDMGCSRSPVVTETRGLSVAAVQYPPLFGFCRHMRQRTPEQPKNALPSLPHSQNCQRLPQSQTRLLRPLSSHSLGSCNLVCSYAHFGPKTRPADCWSKLDLLLGGPVLWNYRIIPEPPCHQAREPAMMLGPIVGGSDPRVQIEPEAVYELVQESESTRTRDESLVKNSCPARFVPKRSVST